MDMIGYSNLKIDMFLNILSDYTECENIVKLIENMISCIPIILCSTDISKLVSMCEVLKSLIFPFEYPGIIIPYEAKLQLKLLYSTEPFIIGIDREKFDQIKEILDKINTVVYDVEQKEFMSNLQVARIVLKLNSQCLPKRKKINLPVSFKLPLHDKVRVKLDKLKTKDRKGQIKAVSHIRDLFRDFFIYQILDIKNVDSVDDFKNFDKILKKKRKHSDHKDFLNSFLKTDFYSTLINYLDYEKGLMFNEDNILVYEFLEK